MNFRFACLIVALLSTPAVASAETMKATLGQPLCVDEQSLVALLMAAISHDEKTVRSLPCEGMAAGSEIEVIERQRDGSTFTSLVKVRVTTPGQPRPITGYTVDPDQ
jgi:hypothetical protein